MVFVSQESGQGFTAFHKAEIRVLAGGCLTRGSGSLSELIQFIGQIQCLVVVKLRPSAPRRYPSLQAAHSMAVCFSLEAKG